MATQNNIQDKIEPMKQDKNMLDTFQNFFMENQESTKEHVIKTPMESTKDNNEIFATQSNVQQVNDINNQDNNNNNNFKQRKSTSSSNKSKASSKKEDPIITYLLNPPKTINDDIIKNSPTLTMYIDDSEIFVNESKKIEINAGGLTNNNGGRCARDGVVIFGGCDTELTLTSIKPDIELNFKNNITLKPYQKYPYVFAIYFQLETKTYYIKAYCGEGSDNMIMFIKLTYGIELTLRRKELLVIGNSIFQVIPLEDDNIEINILAGFPNMGDGKNNVPHGIEVKRFFNKNEISEITIGRDPKCTYTFKTDNSFSRIQTTIAYENGKWIVRDGTKLKPSKNGTWLFGLHAFPIKNDLVVEILSTKIRFRVKECSNNNV